jgi:hypothetical protein
MADVLAKPLVIGDIACSLASALHAEPRALIRRPRRSAVSLQPAPRHRETAPQPPHANLCRTDTRATDGRQLAYSPGGRRVGAVRTDLAWLAVPPARAGASTPAVDQRAAAADPARAGAEQLRRLAPPLTARQLSLFGVLALSGGGARAARVRLRRDAGAEGARRIAMGRPRHDAARRDRQRCTACPVAASPRPTRRVRRRTFPAFEQEFLRQTSSARSVQRSLRPDNT